MANSISQRANVLAKQTVIKGEDAAKLLSMAEKDDKITSVEAKALTKVAKLPNDRFEKDGTSVSSSVDSLRSSSDWANELLAAKLDVKSSVPGLSVSFDKAVTVEESEYGNNYHRFLNVEMKGKTAGKDGSLSFEYGDFKVTVPVKKGMSAQRIFNAVESKVVAQQNGAMSIRGGLESDRVLNPSIGFGIHRTTPPSAVEKLQMARNELQADLMEAQQENAPDAITKPIIAQIKELDAKIKKAGGEG